MNGIPDILLQIVKAKQAEIDLLESRLTELKRKATGSLRPPLDFRKSLENAKNGRAVIAEIKKASPSAGLISENFDPEKTAMEYEQGGASAISVLTEINYFKGAPEYLKQAKLSAAIPILRKDFIVSEAQIYETAVLGADTFLLIAALLDKDKLKGLISLGRSFLMEPLVEIHDVEELEKSLEAGAGIIGINNRNLRTFVTDISLTERLVPLIPKNRIIVGESGINSIETAHRLYSAGCNALLIGEFLMRSSDKAQLIKRITGKCDG